MSSLSTLACGLCDDDVDLSLENEVLKKWGLYDALHSFSDRERISGWDSHNIATDPKADNVLPSWDESGNDNDVYSFSETNMISVYLKDSNYNNAHDCYLKGQFCDALIYLDYAFESIDQSVDARLWTLRAKVMNAVEDHLETLRSIAHVPESERGFELYIEGAKALEKLGLMITAEKWLKTIVLSAVGDIGREKWVQIAYKLLQEIHTQRVYHPFVKEAPVRVSITSSGRGLATTKTVLKGQLLFAELPELSEQNMASDSITACAHCGLSLVKPEDVFSKGHLAIADLQRAFKKFWPKRKSTPCKTCDRVVYCNDTCRDDAWQRYHKVICPTAPNSTVAMIYDVRKSFRDVMPTDGSSWQGWWNAEFSPTLLSKLWATIISTAKLEATGTGQPSKTHWVKAASQFEKYSSAGGSGSAHETIPKMFELMVNIFKRSKVLRYDVTAEDFNKRHLQLQTNFIEFHDVTDALHGFVDRMRQDPKRNKKIGQFFQKPLPRAEFHGLFPLASTINHSCFPNAEMVSGSIEGKPGIRVMATKQIEAGEEVTVTYVDTGLKKTERRQKLWSRYAFLCQCPRCLYEGDGPEVCTHCGKKADDGPYTSSTLVLDSDAPVHESSCLPCSNKPQFVPFSTKVTPSAIAPAAANVTPTSTGTSSTTVTPTSTGTSSTNVTPTSTGTSSTTVTPTSTGTSSTTVTPTSTGTSSTTVTPTSTGTSSTTVTHSTTSTPSTIATPSTTVLSAANITHSTTSRPSKIATPSTTVPATANMTPTTTRISSASETHYTPSTPSTIAAALAKATPFKNSTLSTTDTPSTNATPSATALITNTVKHSTEITPAVVASSLRTSGVPWEISLGENIEVIKTQRTFLPSGVSIFSACTAEITEQSDHRLEQVSTYSILHNANNDSFVMKQGRDESRVTHPEPSVENKSHKQGMSPNALIINQDTDCGSCCHGDRNGNIKTAHNIKDRLTSDTMAGNSAELGAPKLFPHCGRCGRAWYCSQACQKEAWKKGHKKICAKKL